MKRLDNYPSLLNAFLEQHKAVPFVWGESDCCMFACDAVKAIAGFDIAKDYRGKYRTALGANTILKVGLDKIITDIMIDLGIEEINKNFAQRGDLVLIEGTNGDALAIINMNGDVTGQGEFELVHYSLDTIKKAWGIR